MKILENFTSWTNATSNKTETEVYNKPFSVVIIMTVYATFLVVTVTGNGLVCWIILTNRRMHDATNVLLVNLALSDLMMALASTFQFADFVVKDLNLGKLHQDKGCVLV